MKNYQKLIIVTVLGIVIIPQVTFAAWWNPMSWNIFSFLFSKNTQSEITPQTPSAESTPTDTVIELNATTKSDTPSNTSEKKPVKKASKSATLPPQVHNQTPEPSKPAGVLCNGTYWDSCPSGERFVCPASGNAYCEAPMTNDQKCINSYGANSLDSRQDSGSGKLICTCKDGYDWNSTNTACQVVVPSGSESQPSATTKNNNDVQIASLQQQIIDIKTKYYSDLDGINHIGGDEALARGRATRLLNDANQKINIINLQIQQLQLSAGN